jgi:SAM-dependent methyltransferase
MDRQESERAFHNRQALERAARFGGWQEGLRVDDEAYLDHETWIRPAIDRLGPLQGLRVLDYGCGHGMAAVVLAHRGAHVTAFDLSIAYLAEAHERATRAGADVQCVQADGERLPFGDASFDRVWGNAVLHHLDLVQAGRELRRVLRPGGMAVFCEPWGGNPFLAWARRRLRYPGKERTADEQPLGPRDVAVLRTVFSRVHLRGHQFLSMVRRVVRPGRVMRGLERCDDRLLTAMPPLQRFCRYMVLTLWP